MEIEENLDTVPAGRHSKHTGLSTATGTPNDHHPGANEKLPQKDTSSTTTRRTVLAGFIGMGLAACDSNTIENSAATTATTATGINPLDPDPSVITELDLGAATSGEAAYQDPGRTTQSVASRFLGQAAFGGSYEEIEAVQDLGIEGWIDDQISMRDNAKSYERGVSSGWDDAGDAPNFHQHFSTTLAWDRMISSPDVLRQRMVAALCEIFVFNPAHINRTTIFSGGAWLDLISRNAFGSYRELLEEITLSHQMGNYLTLIDSRAEDGTGAGPDENYAREVMQLFSIGLVELRMNGTNRQSGGEDIETYDGDDVVGLARAFTGWTKGEGGGDTIWLNPMQQKARYHESGTKKFLGITIPANTDGETSLKIALDHIANHANVPPFISKQLIQRFVKSNPSKNYVERIANVFKDDGNGERGNLGAVIKAILLDDEARGIPNKKVEEEGKIREPMLSLVHLLRLSGRDSNLNERFRHLAHRLKHQRGWPQAPLTSPSVFNFFQPDYIQPSTRLARRNMVSPEIQIATEPNVMLYANILYELLLSDSFRNGVLTFNHDYLLEYADLPYRLVNQLDLLFCGGAMRESTKETIREAVKLIDADTENNLLKRIRTATYLTMISSDYVVMT